MSILINQCYHWISYHLIEELLICGHSVFGIHDRKNKMDEHLSMFLGRNSLFKEGVPSQYLSPFKGAIIFGNDFSLTEYQVEKIIRINATTEINTKKTTIIEQPLLFGKWMHMNEEGMFYNEKFIPFQSDYFLNNAIYVKDFSKLLVNWLTKGYLPPKLKIYSANSRENEDVLLENSIYIHDNIPINKQLEDVLDHYKKFSIFYP